MSVEHLNESFLTFDLSDKADHKVLKNERVFFLNQKMKKILMGSENLSILETKIHTGLSQDILT